MSINSIGKTLGNKNGMYGKKGNKAINGKKIAMYDTNNNLIESFNKTFKAWYKTKKGFNSFEKANNLIYLFIFHYNFIRPHESLNNYTPAEVAGFASDSLDKSSWFSAA